MLRLFILHCRTVASINKLMFFYPMRSTAFNLFISDLLSFIKYGMFLFIKIFKLHWKFFVSIKEDFYYYYYYGN